MIEYAQLGVEVKSSLSNNSFGPSREVGVSCYLGMAVSDSVLGCSAGTAFTGSTSTWNKP